MMSLVNDCRDFARVWNERLDQRDGGSPELALSLAAHAASCAACGCRDRIFRELESAPASWSVIPAPLELVVERWRAAATASRTLPPRFDRRRSFRVAARWGLVATVVASALICGRASLPLLFPIESAPGLPNGVVGSSPRLEDAFAEARTMTLELAREVSGPAARIGSEAFGWRRNRSILASDLAQFDRDETSTDPVEGSQPAVIAQSSEPAGGGLISGSARYAFRFLVGSTHDESSKPETAEGF